MEHEGLLKCIDWTEVDEKKNSKAKTSIVLSVDKTNYVHIKKATTAKEVWEQLQETFDDYDLERKVGLIRAMISTTSENSSSMEDNVNSKLEYAQKLDSCGFPVPDEWIGVILLDGLPEEFKPMIMAIENSGVKITGDSIKTRLLHEVKESSAESAMYGKNSYKGKNRFANKNNIRCYECNGKGHKATVSQEERQQQQFQRRRKSAPRQKLIESQGAIIPVIILVRQIRQEQLVHRFRCIIAYVHAQKLVKCLRESDVKEIATANNSKMSVHGVGDID